MKLRLALLAAMLVVVATACGSAYEGQPLRYNDNVEYVKPAWVRTQMQWQETGEHPSDADCVIGLTAAGIGVVGAVAAAPAGLTAWLVFGVVGAAGTGWELGNTLTECWNQYTTERPAFEVYTQCPVDKAVLKATFTDWGQATAYVNIPSCKCSFACQIGFRDDDDAAPGLPWSNIAFTDAKHYWHDGPNHLPGMAAVESPAPPLDYEGLAADLGLTYEGCDGVGVIKPEAFAGLPQCQ